MPFLYLAVAILAEVIGTSALKASNGFTVWLPSLPVDAGEPVVQLVRKHGIATPA
jgi:small multidrug resistance pump